uniref:KIB1-4 beta-propeller domain-containing protein n=1 Tax=Noccaea caerulescens TaxID=107243 RepID=A0A1J3EA85_NOCCA
MFSQRDGMFSLPASGGGYVGSWDLRGKPKLQKLRFQDLPRSRKKERELLDSCYSTQHLVESSSGESFLVLWYRTAAYDHNGDDLGPKGFKVFRLEEEGNASYTEDIGDLCLCLSKSESFCVIASPFSGRDLHINSISYIDVDESISTSTSLEVGSFSLSRDKRARQNYSTYYRTKLPYLFPPQPKVFY